MTFLRKSLSEDSVDRYSHTWAFLFLLLLSVITLFIPLSPSLSLRSSTSAKRMDNGGGNEGYPTFSSTCWVPVSFTSSMSAYAHMVCSTAYNDIVQGRNSSSASLFIRDEDSLPPIPRSDGKFDEKKLFASKKSEKVHEARDEMAPKIRDLVSYKTPLYLFILALLLRLPHAIWSFLSSWCGCINVDRTIAAAQTAQSLDNDGQQGVYKEIALILGGPRKKVTGLLYLFMKLLMVMVACIGIYCATHDLLAKTKDLQDQANMDGGTGMAFVSQHSENGTDVQNVQDFPDILFCSFEITQLQNIQSWLIQCIFTPENVSHAIRSASGMITNQAMGDNNMSEDQILLMYKALFTGVLSVFIVLVILNISSLLVWTLTLLLPSCRLKVGLKTDVTVDLLFFITMARLNTNCLVFSELAKLSSQRGSGGKLLTE